MSGGVGKYTHIDNQPQVSGSVPVSLSLSLYVYFSSYVFLYVFSVFRSIYLLFRFDFLGCFRSRPRHRPIHRYSLFFLISFTVWQLRKSRRKYLKSNYLVLITVNDNCPLWADWLVWYILHIFVFGVYEVIKKKNWFVVYYL